ncbi:bifunctional protein-serine/threonine kinase/phosphatase [Poseidonocella sedimentorum]|uniref:Serine/threonine protein kinase n=1 Tax=Poseidonocella sedimentorum TaxID=871652 RepID=A0A1I6DQ53_9RHOB|nr:bifunctional protein-serine/threonine kinase/phosphatase [Poseidonocella sedimentorum]SFR07564.1 Serine/threonine protein kinase [Poseidonocella sedimentorum]
MPKDTASTLALRIGQASSAGVKPVNQDFHGALVPRGRALHLKGAALVLADGISTSQVSAEAAEMTVKALLTDYFATPASWTVRTAASRVIAATNSWLHARSGFAGLAGDADRGHVCTLAALILKARSAHLFHVGDSRIWRLSGQSLEPLTEDHRIALEGAENVLTRAMGAAPRVEPSYRCVPVEPGDVFVLSTDGAHEHWSARAVAARIAEGPDLDTAARGILDDALKAGSDDNLTVQIVAIDALPAAEDTGFETELEALPVPPLPRDGDVIDGITILRQIHSNHRSHIYFARLPGGRRVALKIPSSDARQDRDWLRRFLMEEWIARRIDSPHVLGAPDLPQERSSLYVVTDFIEGQTLRQWMRDTPAPDLEQVRDIVEQVIRGLRMFHRREMLHQDLRPENIMIDRDGTVKIIDFGAAYVAGVQEAAPARAEDGVMGTVQYSAPEYFSNDPVSWSADLFSLGVITYEMLTGALPYGNHVGRIRSPRDRMRLRYRSARDAAHPIPGWLDDALRRAVHPDPARRHPALSEFAANLRAPSLAYRARHQVPLAERDPERFWKTLSGLLALLCLILAVLAMR